MAGDGEPLVARLLAALNGHDVDGFLAMTTDDVVIEASSGREPRGSRFVGRAAVRAQFEDVLRRVRDAHWEPVRHFACAGHAVVEWVYSGTLGGRRMEVAGCDVLDLRDGQIAAKRTFRKVPG
jgi:ketosteroid isomerase-like protein